MAFINWDDSLSIKIDSIDEQHKKLIGMINDFYDSIQNRSNNELISQLISSMKNYTIEHFNFEERLFEKYNYSHSKEHNQEHELFIKKVKELEQKLNSGTIILSFEITSFLKDWLKKHILVSDIKYAGFLIDKGVR
ncbi:MAG: hemerythrin family protein [Bacteroidales bacterium]|nr:hemerythrin family protein [Bacteroidales bacterium]